MPSCHDGPRTGNFAPVTLQGNTTLEKIAGASVSKKLKEILPRAAEGDCTFWGIPFAIKKVVLAQKEPVSVKLGKVKAPWLVFAHTSDGRPHKTRPDGFNDPQGGLGRLNEHAADYVLVYDDGTEVRQEIRQRHQIGYCARAMWGENCFQAVAQHKPMAIPPMHEQATNYAWGFTQTRNTAADNGTPWINWLYAWENPHPNKMLVELRVEPKNGTLILSGLSAGKASSHPLRWMTRRKAVFKVPRGETFDFTLDANGQHKQLALDMGMVISAQQRRIYPNDNWSKTYGNKLPELSDKEIIVEYTAHPDAAFHLESGKTLPVSKLEAGNKAGGLAPVAPATQRVWIRTVEKGSKKPVAVKLHVHGEAGEYLAPVDRHRIPNPAWFEDYSCDFLHLGQHYSTYVTGETAIDLPAGTIYIEVTKGFEIKPIRKVVKVTSRTKTIEIAVEKVLPWRENGWVTADTHVHFLSPQTAMLEGAGEGVNVVNLLASQWGELMTNVGDFDGKTTVGSKEAGGDGEWLVRVGTENRQHVMGHISLLGYDGNIIAPMTTAGPDEAALGDPIEILLTEWARQCHKQGGLVVMPHFPNPRAEHAASIISGDVDGIEMTSWQNLYMGINPYALSDWYRYLNNGYFVPAVAGTDKMTATTAVGTVRTYAKIPEGREFDYAAWIDAVRSGNTFVSYGPLMEFNVDGKPAGSCIKMSRTGGTVDVSYKLASLLMPMTRIEVLLNGEIVASKKVKKRADEGSFRVNIDRSSWVAILVRGNYDDKPEVIAAHSSPVMVEVEGTPFFAAADALTILEQIEGALAYLDTVGTRAEDKAYKRMRLVLTSAHRELHNRMHKAGQYHEHTQATDHAEHHKK